MAHRLASAVDRYRRAVAWRRPRTAVLFGPASSEDAAYFRRTSRGSRSYDDFAVALGALGVPHVELVDVTASPRWFEVLGRVDLVVVNLHGQPGEDGSVQGLLDLLGVPYVGSGVEPSVVALNKHLGKLVAVAAGLATPDFFTVTDGAVVHRGSPEPRGDLICKPLRGGSSIGTFRLLGRQEPPDRGEWIVEAFLPGDDVTVTVVEDGGRPVALPAVVLRHGAEFYDEASKLGPDPALPAVAERPHRLLAALAECEHTAELFHHRIGARHISRTDFVVHRGRPYLLELNTVPGVSRISNCADSAYAAGFGYEDLIALMIGPAVVALP